MQQDTQLFKRTEVYATIKRADGTIDEIGLIDTTDIDQASLKEARAIIAENTKRLQTLNAKTYLRRTEITELPDMNALTRLEAFFVRLIWARRLKRLQRLASKTFN